MKQALFVLSALALTMTEAKTVAYWPMNVSTAGGTDIVRCAISSDNDLVVNGVGAAFADCDIGWNFPPNADMTATAALAGGLLVRQKLTMKDAIKDGVLTNVSERLASSLSPSHDLSVEGWARLAELPALSSTKATSQMFVYMTLAEAGGWAWNLSRPKGAETLQVHVRLTYDNGKGGIGTENLYFASGLTEADIKDSWHHYALTYVLETATWTFYLDGIIKGSATAKTARYDATPIRYEAPRVFINGCKGSTPQSLVGDIACWRVSDKALSAADLLYGTGTTVPEATTKTVAYWKLDRKSDGSIDGADFVGTYGLTSHATAAQVSCATIVNPDESATFKGDSAQNTGSVQIATDQSQTDKCLFSSDKNLLDAFKSDEGWTLEGYVQRTAYHNNFGTLFGLCNNAAVGNNSIVFGLRAVGKADNEVGYQIYDNLTFANVKTEQKVLKGVSYLPANEWTHVALEVSYPTVTNVVQVQYDLFVDGRKEATLQVVRKASFGTIKGFVIGGDTGSQRTFAGWVDSFRLSKGTLEPSEFLCAMQAVPSPVPVSNLAYWAMDNQNGLAVGDTSEGYVGYGFVDAKGTVNGEAVCARSRVPAKSGLPSGNTGSVAVASDSVFKASNLGADLNFGASWSVEGYHKVSESGVTAVCGTYDATSDKGWKLMFDNSGDLPTYRVLAAAGGDPFVNAAFSGVGKYRANDWNHVLLTHDENGTWTLAVNGVSVGMLTSTPRRFAATSGVTGFYIGSGQYDLWRATTGILTVDDSIYEARKGLVVVVK